jgi:hypothetical protein
MADIVGNAAIEKVRNEAMSVGGHGNEIDLILSGYLDNFIGRFAVGQDKLSLKPLTLQVGAQRY